VQEILNELFHNKQCHQVYYKPPLDRIEYVACLEHVAIINRPTEKLEFKHITSNAAEVADEAMRIAELEPDTRSKPVLGLVKGTGGGKTRALEEIRYELLAKDGVLPLAFTFNSNMNFSPKVEFAWSTDYEVCYALSVVSRLLAVFYGMELANVQSILTGHRKLWGEGEDRAYPTELIRGCILHLVSKAPFVVTTVVVLGDEVALAEDKFASKYNLDSSERDVTSVLRSALLDTKIAPHLNAALILASLTITPMGKTVSTRKVVHFTTLTLNPYEIVKHWWKRPEMAALIKVAAALADVPRGVEFAATYLRGHPEPVNAGTIKALLEYVQAEFISWYNPSLRLTLDELHAVFFGEELELNARSMELVKFSLFTNSIVDFNSDTTTAKFIPTASLLLLAAGAQRGAPNNVANSLLKGLLPRLSTVKIGDPLEWGVELALQMRLAIVAGRKDLSLLQLMSLEGEDLNRGSESRSSEVGDGMLDKMAKVNVNVPKVFNQEYDPIPNSQTDLEGFVAFLTAWEMVAGEVRLASIHKKEGFDHLFVVCDDSGEIFLVFIEDWSKKGKQQKKKRTVNDKAAAAGRMGWTRARTPGRKKAGKQAMRVANELVPEVTKANAPRHSVAHALAHGRYAFIYLTSRSGASYTTDHAIDLGRTESGRFLGPLWPVYEAVRGGFNPP
jgi:hypothetical protein